MKLMPKRNSSESGFAHLFLIVAVVGVMGLMVMSNLQLMDQLSSTKSNVLGAAVNGGERGNNLNQLLTSVQSFVQQIVKFARSQ